MYEMMLEAGYSESTAKQQTLILGGLSDELNPIVRKLEERREKAIQRLDKTIAKAKYRDLIDGIDKLTKNIQLLSGGKTSNESVTFTWADAPSSNPVQPEAMGQSSS